jgi:signal transduction histidine kinase
MDTSALTREQLEERLVALHRASLELVRDISRESLMERIATVACQQVSARYAAVGILDQNGKLEKFIPVGMSPVEIGRMAHPPVGKGLIGALMNAEHSIRLGSIAADKRSSGFPAHHPHMDTFLGAPIRHGDQQLGQIYLTNKIGGGEFSADDQAVIEMLASYAAVALSNARLVDRLTRGEVALQRRNENLALLNELAITLASSNDIDEILDKALEQVIEYLSLDAGEIFLRQENGKAFQLFLHKGERFPRLWSQTQFLNGEGTVGRAAALAVPQMIDLSELRRLPDPNGYLLDHSLYTGGPNQVACYPLNGRSGVFGVLCVASSHAQPLDELEMQFLSSISFWIGAAIENARLKVQQRRLAVLEERDRIGMDLHDGIIQDIYAVGLTLEHARLLLEEDPGAARQRIEQAVSDLNSTIRDIRAYILDLRPRKLHEENLMDGLRRLVAEFRANTLVEVSLQGPPGDQLLLPEAPAVALFHICQEALANAAKHAHARHLTVAVWTTSDRALLEVTDDGHGFDASQAPVSIGHGLSNMQTRATNAGGEIEITSEPGAGTTILVWVPVAE